MFHQPTKYSTISITFFIVASPIYRIRSLWSFPLSCRNTEANSSGISKCRSVGAGLWRHISFCRFREAACNRFSLAHCKLNCIIIGNFGYFNRNSRSWCWTLGSSFNLIHYWFRFTFAEVTVLIMRTFFRWHFRFLVFKITGHFNL